MRTAALLQVPGFWRVRWLGAPEFGRSVQAARPLALAAALALPLGASGEPRLGLDPSPLAGLLPLPAERDPGLDPGPPKKEPREEMEPDPAWSWPKTPPAGRTDAAQGWKGQARQLTGVSMEKLVRLVEAGQERGHLLPFFKPRPGEPIGAVHYFVAVDFSRPDPEPIRNLARAGHGFLFWQFGHAGQPTFLTPTGIQATLVFGSNRVLHYLGGNSRGELAFFGDAINGLLINKFAALGSKRSGKDFSIWDEPARGKVRRVFSGGRDDFWIIGETALRHCRIGQDLGPETVHENAPWAEVTSLAAAPDGLTLVATRPDLDRFFLFRDRSPVCWVELPAGSRPHSVATGPDDQVWISLEGSDQCRVYASRNRRLTTFELPAPGAGRWGPRALTLGPDGNLWVALAGKGAIGRITPKGEFTPFPLAPGDVPVELVPTADGLLFTVENSSRIGFIRALAAPKAEPADWAGNLHEPRPDREKKLTRAARKALHDLRIQRANERGLARLEEAAGRSEAASPEPEAEAPTPPLSSPADASPKARLAALGVDLTARDIRHILDHHGCGRHPGKGQFAETHSSREGLEHLLARALEASGVIGRITDSRGRCYTKCASERVGWYHSYGDLVAADHFVVVTAPYYNEHLGDMEHGVVTAFPVHPNW